MKKIVFFLLLVLLIGSSLALGGGLGYFAGLVEEMEVPNKEELATQISTVEQVSDMYYNDGTKISDIRADLVRTRTDLADISPHIINGLVATEDENFFSHQGVVPSAVLRALASTFLGVGGSSGGSTITQQLVKQSILTNEVSFERKAKEMLLAIRVEDFFTKEQILEAYLNISPYGRNNKGENIAGVEEAAQGIFGISANELSLPQAAYIVGLPQNPYTYTPYEQTGQLKSQQGISYGIERQHEVLDRMLLTHTITEEDYNQAIAYDVRQDFLQPADPTANNNRQSYLYQAVERDAIEILMTNAVEADGLSWDEVYADDELYNDYYFESEEELRKGGYTINSTIDKDVYEAMNSNVAAYADALGSTYYSEVTDPTTGETVEVAEPVQTGQVLMDNASGAVIAFVGGRDFESNQVDHAFATRRQPGSTIKPLLVYGPAMQEGIISPATMLADTYIRKEYASGAWEPSNFGSTISQSFVTARHALAMSLNNPTVHLYEELLNQRVDVQSYMYKMGWDEALNEDEFTNLGLSLGGAQTGPTVAELTSTFATFGNNGQYKDAYLIESIVDTYGNTIYQHENKVTQVFSPDVAYTMVDMLQSVISEGTWENYQDDLHVDADWYVKTGTTEEFNDLWVTASSPKVTMTSWIGYDNSLPGQSMNNGRTLDDGNETAVYGMPGPRSTMFWINQANALHAQFPDLLGTGLEFERPDNIQEAEVIADTGTKAGKFEGPYDLQYNIPTSAKKTKEIFPENYTIPDANFNYVIGGKVDETVDALEKYRVKNNANQNKQATDLRRQYALRKQENQTAIQRLFQNNEL